MFFHLRCWYTPLLLGLILAATACTPELSLETATATPINLHLTPYSSPTTTPSTAGTELAEIPRTPTPLPTLTPTPFTYSVARGDTMLGIALRFGLTLEELQAANPEVDPHFLSVDTDLVIPLEGESPEVQPTPTPEALRVEPARCYTTVQGAVWCFILATNQNAFALENIVARVRLFAPSGEVADEGEAIMPLNLLPAGEAQPLVIFFPPPLPRELIPQVELLAALPVPGNAGRYLSANIDIGETKIQEHGLQNTIRGKISLPNGSPEAGVIWLALVAYDQDGRVVGVRKWEAESGLTPGDSLAFEVEVYSLGDPIARVAVLSEVRP